MAPFSLSNLAVISSFLPLSSAYSFSRASNFFLEPSSFSLVNASFSISSCISFLLTTSSSDGSESISVLIMAPASSIRSIALSGKYLSDIYLSDNLAAATNAES